jgi:hypothetical protein
MGTLILYSLLIANTAGLLSNYKYFLKWKQKRNQSKDSNFLDYLTDEKKFTETEKIAIFINDIGLIYAMIEFFKYLFGS